MSPSLLSVVFPQGAEARRSFENVLAFLEGAAFRDRLTGLWNGQALELFAKARERQPPFAVIFVDLSGFKAINDKHGHEAGDAALSTVAKYLQSETEGQRDLTAFRKGGDEFVAIAESADDARAFARDLAAAFSAGLSFPFVRPRSESGPAPTTSEPQTLTISGAVGVCIRSDSQSTLHTLMQRADSACRSAKFNQAQTFVEWAPDAATHVEDQRKVCPQCRTTTSILYQSDRLKPNALSTCGNCGAPL